MNDEPDRAPDWADVTEGRLLTAALEHAETQGWSRRLVAAAAHDVGLTRAEAELLLPEGPRDLAALLSRRDDTAALGALATIDPVALKIRDRIRTGVLARIEAAMDHEPATRRWMGFLALPPNALLGLRLLWASADTLWRWAGDTATDENHYTKRVLLADILVSTLAVRLAADAKTAATHLDWCIEGVMTFERWKGRFKPADAAAKIAGALGRLRYGGGVRRGPEPGRPVVSPARGASTDG
jgi:ubiquinone biosynthesis protein COQ9